MTVKQEQAFLRKLGRNWGRRPLRGPLREGLFKAWTYGFPAIYNEFNPGMYFYLFNEKTKAEFEILSQSQFVKIFYISPKEIDKYFSGVPLPRPLNEETIRIINNTVSSRYHLSEGEQFSIRPERIENE